MTKYDKKKALEKYAWAKLKMLKSEFKIRITKEDIEHMHSLESELRMDNFAHSLIMNRI